MSDWRAWAQSHRRQLMLGGAGGVVSLALYERHRKNTAAAATGVTTGTGYAQVPVSYGDPQAAGIGQVGSGGYTDTPAPTPSGTDPGAAIGTGLSSIGDALNKIAGLIPGRAPAASTAKTAKKAAKKPAAKKPVTAKVSKPRPSPKPRKTGTARHGGAPAHGAAKAYPVHTLPGAPATPKTHRFPVKSPVPVQAQPTHHPIKLPAGIERTSANGGRLRDPAPKRSTTTKPTTKPPRRIPTPKVLKRA